VPDLTVAELARRYNVSRSTVSRALTGGRTGRPGPGAPGPVNPGEPQLRYSAEKVDAWWPSRPRPGRQAAPPPPVEDSPAAAPQEEQPEVRSG
jgi:transcriptional regulator with XRE-family HTH domain